MADRIEELRKRKAKALQGESKEAVQRQHDRGKLTARERCEILLDPGSFVEFDQLALHRARGFGLERRRVYGDGVVTGWGTIDGRKVFVFMVKGISNMQITGPDVIKTVTGEDVTLEELGGAMSHATKSGVASFVAEDEEDCYAQVRHLLSYLPSNNLEEPPYLETGDPIDRTDPDPGEVLPDASNQPYDMHDVITRVIDKDTFYEYFPFYAPNIITGFARLGGHTIGIIANQPRILAGALNVTCSEKAARFIRTCDAFNVPIVVFMDVPGFQPGTDQEWGGIIRRGAKLLYAFTEATVPRLTVITRKAYGGAYVVMNSKHIRADICFAWPTAEFAVMGADAAVPIIQRREIEAADDPAAKRAELIDHYKEQFLNPW